MGLKFSSFPASHLGLTRRPRRREAVIQGLLFFSAAISILTTAGIIYELGKEALLFFQMPDVSFLQTITSTRWQPHTGEFGVWGLVTATFMTSLIAMLVAGPLGLAVAIYLSEYATPRTWSDTQASPGSPGGRADDRLRLLCTELHDPAPPIDFRPGHRPGVQHRLRRPGDGHPHPAADRLHDRGRPNSRPAFAAGGRLRDGRHALGGRPCRSLCLQLFQGWRPA